MKKLALKIIKIYPTKEQIKYFRKAFKVRKLTWNTLSVTYNRYGVDNNIEYSKQIVDKLKEDDSRVNEVAPSILDNAMSQFDRRMQSKRGGGVPGRKNMIQAFMISGRWSFMIIGKELYLDKLNSGLKKGEGINLPYAPKLKGTLKSITIYIKNGKWYAKISLLEEAKEVGIGMGVDHVFELSDGKKYGKVSELKELVAGLADDKDNKNMIKLNRWCMDLVREAVIDVSSRYMVVAVATMDLPRALDVEMWATILQTMQYEFKSRLSDILKKKGGRVLDIYTPIPCIRICANCGAVVEETGYQDKFECNKCGTVKSKTSNMAKTAITMLVDRLREMELT